MESPEGHSEPLEMRLKGRNDPMETEYFLLTLLPQVHGLRQILLKQYGLLRGCALRRKEFIV